MLFISIAGCGGEQAAQNNTNVTKEVTVKIDIGFGGSFAIPEGDKAARRNTLSIHS